MSQNTTATPRDQRQHNLVPGDARALHRQPGADGRERECDAQKHMGIIRKALGEGIKTDDEQRDGRKIETDRIQKPACCDQPGCTEEAQESRARQRNFPRGQMTHGGPRIGCVKLPIHNPVEGHRAGSGANHGGEDEPEGSPTRPAVIFPGCDHHGREGKRQRKNRVRKFDELGPFANGGNHGLA